MLSESPQNVPPIDFNLNDTESNLKLVESLKRKQHQVDIFNDKPIYKSGVYYYTISDLGLISFLVKVQNDKIHKMNFKYVTQVAVWRKRGYSEYSHGTASYVFWNILFKIHELVMSDGEQTPLGRAFWEDVVADALNKKLTVSAVNIRTQTISPILSLKDLPDSYGDTKVFQLKRIVISKGPLKFESPMASVVDELDKLG